MANPTDMFTEEELQQGILNFEAVRNLCIEMRLALPSNDPMREHFSEVIKFCNLKVGEGIRLLRREPVAAEPTPSRIILATDPNRFLK